MTTKQKQSVFIATSLDGFIARPDGDIDWLNSGDGHVEGEDFGYSEFMETVDALVMGRNTFDKVRDFDPWPYNKKVFVLTGRPLDLSDTFPGEVESMSGKPGEIVNELAEKGFFHLYIDGGETICRFLKAGLIEEMTITRIPILIGEGIPLFHSLDYDIPLHHVWTHAFPNGFVQSKYSLPGF